ncbi:hypothetical protein [Amycolatopsis magusensis]|uniref:hypothetical protein n=1 Tax=Amycolatopsis magusensis TaxID=882444 RepID=UPI0037B5D7A9
MAAAVAAEAHHHLGRQIELRYLDAADHTSGMWAHPGMQAVIADIREQLRERDAELWEAVDPGEQQRWDRNRAVLPIIVRFRPELSRHGGTHGQARHAVPDTDARGSRRHRGGRALCKSASRPAPMPLGPVTVAPPDCPRCLTHLRRIAEPWDLREIIKHALAAGLMFGLVFGLMVGLRGELAGGLAVGLVFGPGFGLAVGLKSELAGGVPTGLAGGLTVGLIYGQVEARYVALLLCTRGWFGTPALPWRLGRFPHWCYQAGLVRQAGIATSSATASSRTTWPTTLNQHRSMADRPTPESPT